MANSEQQTEPAAAFRGLTEAFQAIGRIRIDPVELLRAGLEEYRRRMAEINRRD